MTTSSRRGLRQKNRASRSRDRRLRVEQLEDRRLLAVQLLYNASNELQLIGNAAADNVTLLQTAADVLVIDLNGASFAAGSTPAGGNLTYAPGLTSATISGLSGNSVARIDVNLGGGNDLVSMTLDLAGNTDIGDIVVLDNVGNDTVTLGVVAIGGSLAVNADAIELNGATAAAIDQEFLGPVELADHVVLTAQNVTFAQTVDSDGAGPWDLTITTSGGGTTWFQDDVGATAPLRNLVTNADGQTDLDAAQIFTIGDQTYGDPVLLTTHVELQSADVTFLQTVDSDTNGPWDLTVNTTGGGVTLFQGDVGVTAPLRDLVTNADGQTDLNGTRVITTGDQTYADPMVLTTDVTLQAANVTFAQTVDSDAAGPWQLTVNTSGGGTTRFEGNVGVTLPLRNLVTNADGQTDLNGTRVITTGDQTYADPVVLTTDVTLQATNVTFAQTVDSDAAGPWQLTVNTSGGGTTRFEGNVGVTLPLRNLVTNADGQTDLNGAQVITAGDQTYADPVVLTTDVTLQATNVTFAQTIDSDAAGPWQLTVNTSGGGTTRFEGNVGVTLPLRNLVTNADGQTDLNGTRVITTGDQTYADPVVLTTDVTLQATNVTFAQTVDSDAAGPWQLTVNTSGGGTTRFEGNVGVTLPLRNLVTNADGQTDLNGAQVITAGDQTYADPVVLTTDVTLQATNVTFAQTVDSDAAGPWQLTVNTSGGGTTRFEGNVGVTLPLRNLVTNADGQADLNGAQVITAGDQTYADPVVLTTDVTLQATNVTFAQTVDSDAAGPWQLTVNTSGGGTTRFEGNVGVTLPLRNLVTNADGQTDLNGAQVITAGDQTYADPVVLTTDVTLRAANVTFEQTVDSDAVAARDLTVNTTGGGVTWFQGDVGASGPTSYLRNLDTNGDGITQLGSVGNALMQVITLYTQGYGDPVLLLSHTRIEGSAATAGDDAVVFENRVDSEEGGPFDLTIDTVRVPASDFGVTRFVGPVGSTRPVRDVSVETAGPFEVVANITTNRGPNPGDPLGDITINIIDRPTPAEDDFRLIQSPIPADPVVRIASVHGAISIVAGDDIAFDPRTAVEALAGRINLRVDSDLPPSDALTGGVLDIQGAAITDGVGQPNHVAAPTIDMEGGADDDTFLVQFARFRPSDVIRFDGGGYSPLVHDVLSEGITTRTAPTGGACGGSTASFQVVATPLPTGDRLTAIDSDAVVTRDYFVDSGIVAQVGGPVFQYTELQQLELIAGAGDDTLRIASPVLGVSGPVIVTFDGNGGDDHVIIHGSSGDDQIIVGRAYFPPRSVFEVANTEFLWVRGGAGNDFIMNDTAVPSILEGDGLGVVGRFNDTLIGGSSVDLLFAGRGEDVLFGGGGNDYLYADTDFDGVSGGVLYLSEAADETLGDYLDGGSGVNSAVQVGTLDRVVRITGTLLDGGACKDVITWLKAQIVSLGGGAAASEAVVNDLVTQGLAALGVTLRDFDGPVVVVPLSLAILANRLDVNGDGSVSPRDALIVINLLNQIGPGTVDDVWQRLNGLAGGEGESGAYFDVNRDDYLSPRDALLIVNELNRASGEGEFAGRAPSNTRAANTGVLSSVQATDAAESGREPLAAFCSSFVSQASWQAATSVAQSAGMDRLGPSPPTIVQYGPMPVTRHPTESIESAVVELIDEDLLEELAVQWLSGQAADGDVEP